MIQNFRKRHSQDQNCIVNRMKQNFFENFYLRLDSPVLKLGFGISRNCHPKMKKIFSIAFLILNNLRKKSKIFEKHPEIEARYEISTKIKRFENFFETSKLKLT